MKLAAVAIVAVALLAGCPARSYWELPQDEWVCTKERVVNVKPFMTLCVQYSRLA